MIRYVISFSVLMNLHSMVPTIYAMSRIPTDASKRIPELTSSFTEKSICRESIIRHGHARLTTMEEIPSHCRSSISCFLPKYTPGRMIKNIFIKERIVILHTTLKSILPLLSCGQCSCRVLHHPGFSMLHSELKRR